MNPEETRLRSRVAGVTATEYDVGKHYASQLWSNVVQKLTDGQIVDQRSLQGGGWLAVEYHADKEQENRRMQPVPALPTIRQLKVELLGVVIYRPPRRASSKGPISWGRRCSCAA